MCFLKVLEDTKVSIFLYVSKFKKMYLKYTIALCALIIKLIWGNEKCVF